jgi:hypothetical protein
LKYNFFILLINYIMQLFIYIIDRLTIYIQIILLTDLLIDIKITKLIIKVFL